MINLGLLGCLVTLFDAVIFPVCTWNTWHFFFIVCVRSDP